MELSNVIGESVADAFAAECQVIQRLLWAAEAADVDGYPDIASTYRSIAEVKQGHAQGLVEFMYDPDDTSGNLDSFINEVDVSASLRTKAGAAEAAGRHDVAEWFEAIAIASERHLERLRNSADQLR